MDNTQQDKIEDIVTSRADDVMAYEASGDPESPFFQIEIVIERWNGKGFTGISIYGEEDKAAQISEFAEHFFRQTTTSEDGKPIRGSHVTRMKRAGGGFVVTVHGKKADIEKKIVKVFTMYNAVERRRLENAARVTPSGLVTVTDANVIEMVKRGGRR